MVNIATASTLSRESSRANNADVENLMSPRSDGKVVDNNCTENKVSSLLKPKLRHTGSSTETFATSSSSFADDDNDVRVVNEYTLEKKASSSLLRVFLNSTSMQIHGMLSDFRKSNMPWEGPQCRSILAGGSGVLLALPAVVCPNPLEQLVWIVQGVLSFMADYIHIHHDSIWHGIDRYSALSNFIYLGFRSYHRLHWSVLLWSTPCVGCFFGANSAKSNLDLMAWHRWHCAWHISGAILAAMTIHLLYACPTPASLGLDIFCQHV